VKAGSFLPLAPDFQSTDSYPADTIFIRYYNHNSITDANYTLFEDDGKDRLSLVNNKYETTVFTANASKKQLTIKIAGNNGMYKGKPADQMLVLTVYNCTQKPRSIKMNKTKVHWNYNENKKTLTVACKRTNDFQFTINY
jgi:oligosaccharide 4-alpha-D-glucosyltransferase